MISDAGNTSNGTTPILEESDSEKLIKYGEVVLLGFNGSLPKGDRGKKRSKFILHQRRNPNSVKRLGQYQVKMPNKSRATFDDKLYAISHRLSSEHSVIVEYIPDESSDMFQMGRSCETPIDCVLTDTQYSKKNSNDKVKGSTISRYACRIVVDRNTKLARIYAAGFDSSRKIFLGEKSIIWEGNEIDALTTNGVLILHPKGNFCEGEPACKPWHEVSVEGIIYSARQLRSSKQKGQVIDGESNILQDGGLIDFCGATVLWRSGITSQKQKEMARQNEEQYVYMNCGHVYLHSNNPKCPVCLNPGPVTKLCIGLEPAFHIDSGSLSHAFTPCGHMASEKTVKYWANTSIPYGTDRYYAICSFCSLPLSGNPGFVKLIN